jgi:hypothetical protein
MTTAISKTDTQALIQRAAEMDKLDDDQILESLAGNLSEQYAYSFKVSGKQVEGLSWRGYMELLTRRGGYRFSKPEVEDAGDHWRAYAEVTDLIQNVTVWAGTHQAKNRRVKEGNGYRIIPDDYAFEKAISKAQRNAAKNVVPQYIQAEALSLVLHGKALPGGRSTREAPVKPRALPKGRQKAQSEAGTVNPTELPIPANLGQLYDAGVKHLKYQNKSEILRAIGVTGEADIADLADAWDKLLTDKGYIQGTSPYTPEEEEEMRADLDGMFGRD